MNEKILKDRASRRRAVLDKIQKIASDIGTMVRERIAQNWISLAGNWDPDKVQHVPFNLPVGNDKFKAFVKKELMILGEEEIAKDEDLLKTMTKNVANQINDKHKYPHPISGIESTDTTLYKVRASLFREAKTVYDDRHVNHEYLGPYSKPDEHSRYCPEHPGVQMRRVKDKVYQCPMNGDTFSYNGGHEVTFETGVNQQTALFTDSRPRSLLTEFPQNDKYRSKEEYSYEREGLYNKDLPEIHDGKEYHTFGKNPSVSIPRKGSFKGFCKVSQLEKEKKQYKCTNCGYEAYDKMAKCPKCNAEMRKIPHQYVIGSDKVEKKAGLFGETTMNSRYCPDHPGEQMGRVSDNIYQCSLDGKVYDYNQGFTTNDGEEHNGGSVQNQKEFAIFRAPPRPFGRESSVKGFVKVSQMKPYMTMPGKSEQNSLERESLSDYFVEKEKKMYKKYLETGGQKSYDDWKREKEEEFKVAAEKKVEIKKQAQEEMVSSQDIDAEFASCALGYKGEEARDFAKRILERKISDRRSISEIIAEEFAKKKQKEDAIKLLHEQKIQEGS